jgi:TetR/AcrR family transcriptional repressor of bet genes
MSLATRSPRHHGAGRDEAPPATRPKRRSEAKVYQRRLIIESAIDVIVEHGLEGATVSRIVGQAGIARGMVNLYFRTKDALLLEVLSDQYRSYLTRFSMALAAAAPAPLAQLAAVIDFDLSEDVLNERDMALWFAFRAATRSHPEYAKLVESRVPEYEKRLTELFRAAPGVSRMAEARDLARGFALLVEGAWVDFYLHPRSFDRRAVRRICRAFVNRAFQSES